MFFQNQKKRVPTVSSGKPLRETLNRNLQYNIEKFLGYVEFETNSLWYLKNLFNDSASFVMPTDSRKKYKTMDEFEILWNCDMTLGMPKKCCKDPLCEKLDLCQKMNFQDIYAKTKYNKQRHRPEYLKFLRYKTFPSKQKASEFVYGTCCTFTVPHRIEHDLAALMNDIENASGRTLGNNNIGTEFNDGDHVPSSLIKRFLVFKLTIQLKMIGRDTPLNHANIVVVDGKNQTMERFEPFGPHFYSLEEISRLYRQTPRNSQMPQSPLMRSSLTRSLMSTSPSSFQRSFTYPYHLTTAREISTPNKNQDKPSPLQFANLTEAKTKLVYFHYFHDSLNTALEQFANAYGLKFLDPSHTSPYFGAQYFQQKEQEFIDRYRGDSSFTSEQKSNLGFCTAWIVWYIEMRLRWPDRDIVKLVENFCIDHNGQLTQFIERYSLTLQNQGRTY